MPCPVGVRQNEEFRFFPPSFFFFFPRNCSASGSFNIVQIPLHTGAVSSRSRVDKVRNNSAPADSAQFCNAVLTLTTKTGARRRLGGILLRHRTVCESLRALQLAGEHTNMGNKDSRNYRRVGFFGEREISVSLMKHVCSFWLGLGDTPACFPKLSDSSHVSVHQMLVTTQW